MIKRNSFWTIQPGDDSYSIVLVGSDGRRTAFRSSLTKPQADNQLRHLRRKLGRHGERIGGSTRNSHHSNQEVTMAAKRSTKATPKKKVSKKTAKATKPKAAKSKTTKKGSRSAEALGLRRQGLSFGEIAERMNYHGEYPSSAAFTMVKNGLRAERGGDDAAVKAGMAKLAKAAKAKRTASEK